MEFKKKTIIWEDNNEPPKDYIWAKKDGKFYEYSYATRSWIESKSISGGSGGSGGGSDEGGGGSESSDSGSYLMGLIPNNYPKPDLFLYERGKNDDNPVDVTNYEIDDLLNLLDTEENLEIPIKCLYESSNLDKPIVVNVLFSNRDITITFFGPDDADDVKSNMIVYNNKTYYYYSKQNNPK